MEQYTPTLPLTKRKKAVSTFFFYCDCLSNQKCLKRVAPYQSQRPRSPHFLDKRAAAMSTTAPAVALARSSQRLSSELKPSPLPTSTIRCLREHQQPRLLLQDYHTLPRRHHLLCIQRILYLTIGSRPNHWKQKRRELLRPPPCQCLKIRSTKRSLMKESDE